MNIRKKVGIVLACVFGMAVVINTLFHIYSSDWTENCDTQSAELLNSVRNPSFEELASRLVLEETDGQTPKNWDKFELDGEAKFELDRISDSGK